MTALAAYAVYCSEEYRGRVKHIKEHGGGCFDTDESLEKELINLPDETTVIEAATYVLEKMYEKKAREIWGI